MEPVIDHIQITVRDMAAAVPFYDRLMPLLGYDLEHRVNTVVDGHLHVCNYEHPRLGFCISSPRDDMAEEQVHRRRPGSLHHLAFRAGSREEVDAMYAKLVEIGATIVTEPRSYPEYGPHYYAVFFKDPDGIKLEVVHDAPA